MDKLEFLSAGSAASLGSSFEATALSMLLALVLGQLVAWVYAWTHAGVSYSRGFTQSLVVITMVVALVMIVIGDNIITAFGLIGALAIVRFRNVLKDTRDLVFVFMCLVLGMAVGSGRHGSAVVGTVFLLGTVLYLQVSRFGHRGYWDGHLTCWTEGPEDDSGGGRLSVAIDRFCSAAKRLSSRSGAEGNELVYQVRLRDRRRHRELLDHLHATPGVGQAALILRDELHEV